MLSAESKDILAICVATTVAAGVAGWIVAVLRHSPFTVPQSLLYALNYVLARVLWRTRIRGAFPIAADRGALIVCNHRCPLDPSFVTLAVPRAIHWMVAKEYCEYPGFRAILRTCEVIPVDRGGVDVSAVKTAIRLLRSGQLVGLFPEGRINLTDQVLLPGGRGAAMIARKAGVPVVPCFIHGAPYDGTTLGCLLMPASVQLEIGAPIEMPTPSECRERHQSLDDLTRQILIAIAILGGRPDFQPKVAETTAGIADTRR
jgi:1-acyl-sn-glycerol-3-phosphate acyltransferase